LGGYERSRIEVDDMLLKLDRMKDKEDQDTKKRIDLLQEEIK
jgi:hypothetical protein